MTNNTIQTIKFTDVEGDILTLAQVVLIEANERGFFATKLDSGELFDLFENWALSYQMLHKLDYDASQTHDNMTRFFLVNSADNRDLIKLVRETFDLICDTGTPNPDELLDTIPTFLEDEEMAFVLEVPWISGDIPEHVRAVLDNDPDDATFALHDGALTQELFYQMFADIQQHVQSEPYLYQRITTRLVALDADDQKDVKQTFKALEAALDILLAESDGKELFNVYDLVDFIYNSDYSSLVRTNRYLTQSIEQVEQGLVDSLPYYEGASALQQHFLEARRAVPSNTAIKTLSPLLYLYADMIEEFALAQEEANE